MKKDVLKRTLIRFIERFLMINKLHNIELESVDSYPIPGSKSGNILIINLNSDECLDEEEKFKLEEKIKYYYQNQKTSISIWAPFSATMDDILLVNFRC